NLVWFGFEVPKRGCHRNDGNFKSTTLDCSRCLRSDGASFRQAEGLSSSRKPRAPAGGERPVNSPNRMTPPEPRPAFDRISLRRLVRIRWVAVAGPWTALVVATVFISSYTWSVAAEARRLRDAVAATQLALAREQRVSAVGGLAAAAAHELGSPLATIAVVAKELARELPPDSP